MKTYRIMRDGFRNGRVRCDVEVDDSGYPLPHLVHHSPDGFEYGYGGSGPSDLARSIVGDFLSDRNPHPDIYNPFKWKFIAGLKGEGPHIITDDQIDEWMLKTGMYQKLKT